MPKKPVADQRSKAAKADPLAEVLVQVRERIQRAEGRRLGEQNTKATLIEPVLRALGWEPANIEEVVHEYKVKRKDKPVDYALLTLRTPRLFVEAKALGENLNDRKWANQIMGYAMVAGVEWVILTDGNEYRLYNTHAPVAVDEKLFRKVKIIEDESLVPQTLSLISKDKMQDNLLETLWKAHFVDRQVKAALEHMFSPHEDMVLVNYVLNKAKSLSTTDIRASLARCETSFAFPVLTAEVIYQPTKKKGKPKKVPVTPKPPVAGSLSDLISARILLPPVRLTAKYRSRELEATIESDGRVRFQGDMYDSLSTAASWARVSVIGRRGGKLPATNGWDFWRCIDPDGALVQVGQLRSRLPAQRKASAG